MTNRTARCCRYCPVPERRNSDYDRNGTTDLFTALNIVICLLEDKLRKGKTVLKRNFGWRIAILALMSVTALAVTSVPASAADGGQIKHDSSDFCLTNGGSTANSAKITQYTCNGSSNQTWSLYQGDSFKNNTSKKCLTTGGSHTNSTPITQYTCNGSANQQWVWSNYPDGSWDIQNVGTEKCISNGGSTTNSAPITQYTCNGSANQAWTSPVIPS